MSFSRQIAQINSVTRNSENGSYNTGSNSNYNRSKEDFKAKVISDYHHSRKVSVKQKSRNSRYRLDNRNRGDHDDRDDDDGHGRRAGAKDISKRIGNRDKGKKKHWSDGRVDRRNYAQIDMDEVLYEDATGSDWMRIKMTIPRSESDRPLLFKDEMMKLFHQKIPNFADKDVIYFLFPIARALVIYFNSIESYKLFSQI